MSVRRWRARGRRRRRRVSAVWGHLVEAVGLGESLLDQLHLQLIRNLNTQKRLLTFPEGSSCFLDVSSCDLNIS